VADLVEQVEVDLVHQPLDSVQVQQAHLVGALHPLHPVQEYFPFIFHADVSRISIWCDIGFGGFGGGASSSSGWGSASSGSGFGASTGSGWGASSTAGSSTSSGWGGGGGTGKRALAHTHISSMSTLPHMD
jgi:hypothetical protein